MKKLFRSKWFYLALFAAVAASAWPLTERYYPILQKTIAEVVNPGDKESPPPANEAPKSPDKVPEKGTDAAATPAKAEPNVPEPNEISQAALNAAHTPLKQKQQPVAAPVKAPAVDPAAPNAGQNATAPAPNLPAVESDSQEESLNEPDEEKTFSSLVDAYVYAWPLVLMNKLKEEMTGSIYFAPVNKMAYLPNMPSPYWQTGECPNVDSLTSLAWLDLKDGPQVVIIPAQAKHGFMLELLDAWTHVVLAFNNREEAAFPERVLDDRTIRSFVLVGPNYDPAKAAAIPNDMKIIKAPTNLVWLINRVLLGAPRDQYDSGIASAARCLYEFELMPLEAFLKASHNIPVNTALGNLFFRAGENGLYLSDGSEDAGKTLASNKEQQTNEPTNGDKKANGEKKANGAKKANGTPEKNGGKKDNGDQKKNVEKDTKASPMQVKKGNGEKKSVHDNEADSAAQKDPKAKKTAKSANHRENNDNGKKDSTPAKNGTNGTRKAKSEKNVDDRSDADDADDDADDTDNDADDDADDDANDDADDDADDDARQTEEAVEQDADAEARLPLQLVIPPDEEIETQEQVELATPVTRYCLQCYRNRAWYVAYTQQVQPQAAAPAPRQAKPAAQPANAPAVAEEAATITVTEQPEPTLRDKIAEDLKEGVQLTKEKFDELKDSSGKLLKKAETEGEELTDRGWNDAKAVARYLDRKAKRDLIAMDQMVSRFINRESWSQSAVRGVANMKGEVFFETFAKLLADNPPAADDGAMLKELAGLGIVPGKPFDVKALDPTMLYFMRYAAPFAQSRIRQTAVGGAYKERTDNNWLVFDNFGNYGTDYLERAIIASEFIGANTAREILYPFTNLDDAGRFLTGENTYLLHFDKDQLPPTDLLWSLTMYDRNHYLVPNRLNRYGIRSNQPLVYNPDGSLDLTISREEPREKVSNWLPAPQGEFMLMMRVYQPKETALSGDWKVPAVRQQ